MKNNKIIILILGMVSFSQSLILKQQSHKYFEHHSWERANGTEFLKSIQSDIEKENKLNNQSSTKLNIQKPKNFQINLVQEDLEDLSEQEVSQQLIIKLQQIMGIQQEKSTIVSADDFDQCDYNALNQKNLSKESVQKQKEMNLQLDIQNILKLHQILNQKLSQLVKTENLKEIDELYPQVQKINELQDQLQVQIKLNETQLVSISNLKKQIDSLSLIAQKNISKKEMEAEEINQVKKAKKNKKVKKQKEEAKIETEQDIQMNLKQKSKSNKESIEEDIELQKIDKLLKTATDVAKQVIQPSLSQDKDEQELMKKHKENQKMIENLKQKIQLHKNQTGQALSQTDEDNSSDNQDESQDQTQNQEPNQDQEEQQNSISQNAELEENKQESEDIIEIQEALQAALSVQQDIDELDKDFQDISNENIDQDDDNQ